MKKKPLMTCPKSTPTKPMVNAFKEAKQEAISNDSEVVRVAQQAYCKAHKVIFKQEGLYDLTYVFQQMALDMNLLNSEIHEVQEVWTGWTRLKATNHAAKDSTRTSSSSAWNHQINHPTLWG